MTSENTTPAPGGASPSRRAFMAAVPAATLAAAVPSVALAVPLPLASPEPDPLLALIEQYRREVAIYNLSESDTDDNSGWCEPFEILCSDPPAPTTFRGALEAIRLVADEAEDCGGGQDDMTVAVLRAVDRFLATVTA